MTLVTPGRQHFTAQAMDGWATDRYGKPVPVLGSYWEHVPCNEENCKQFVTGMVTSLDESRADMKDAAEWIRHKSGMAFTESHDLEGLTTFTFPPGQQCFRGRSGGHAEPTGKPAKLYHETLAGKREFTRRQDFNESMNEQTYAAQRLKERG